MKPLFIQMRDARKANSIPWPLIKAINKIGSLSKRDREVVTIREIISDFNEVGVYKHKLLYIKREVKWHIINGYKVLP